MTDNLYYIARISTCGVTNCGVTDTVHVGQRQDRSISYRGRLQDAISAGKVTVPGQYIVAYPNCDSLAGRIFEVRELLSPRLEIAP